MSTIQQVYKQAELTEAAYSSFIDENGNLLSKFDDLKKTLMSGAGKMSESQATAFLDRWDVVSQYSAPNILGIFDGGFSATLFRDRRTNEYSFAIRGTVGLLSDLIGTDFSIGGQRRNVFTSLRQSIL